MKSNFLLILFLSLVIFSCSEEKEETQADIKEGTGTVWLSGGLYFCAEQIRMNGGDTLIIVNNEKLLSYKSGDKVSVIYRETGLKESGCNIGQDCEIIEIAETD